MANAKELIEPATALSLFSAFFVCTAYAYVFGVLSLFDLSLIGRFTIVDVLQNAATSLVSALLSLGLLSMLIFSAGGIPPGGETSENVTGMFSSRKMFVGIRLLALLFMLIGGFFAQNFDDFFALFIAIFTGIVAGDVLGNFFDPKHEVRVKVVGVFAAIFLILLSSYQLGAASARFKIRNLDRGYSYVIRNKKKILVAILFVGSANSLVADKNVAWVVDDNEIKNVRVRLRKWKDGYSGFEILFSQREGRDRS